MSNNIYLIIGALIVVVLIAVAVIRTPKKKKTKPPAEAVAEPPVQVPPVTADTGEWTLKLDDAPSTLPAQPAIQKGAKHAAVCRAGGKQSRKLNPVHPDCPVKPASLAWSGADKRRDLIQHRRQPAQRLGNGRY